MTGLRVIFQTKNNYSASHCRCRRTRRKRQSTNSGKISLRWLLIFQSGWTSCQKGDLTTQKINGLTIVKLSRRYLQYRYFISERQGLTSNFFFYLKNLLFLYTYRQIIPFLQRIFQVNNDICEYLQNPLVFQLRKFKMSIMYRYDTQKILQIKS